MAQTATHEGSDQIPTDGSMRSTAPGDHIGARAGASTARKLGGAGIDAIADTVGLPRDQLPSVSDELRFLVKAFNGEINGDVNMTNEVMIEQALRIMAELGVDLMTLKQYAQALCTTFQELSQPDVKFAAFDNDTTMRVSHSPTAGKVLLKIDVMQMTPDLLVKFPDGEYIPILNMATGAQMSREYILRQMNARAAAQEQLESAPWNSTEAAEAVIGYARLGRNLLEEGSLNFGPEAQQYAKEAQQLLRDYAVEAAEEVWAGGTQKDGANSTILIALMIELRHLNNDTVTKMLEVLDRVGPALGPRLRAGMAALANDFKEMRKLLEADREAT